MKTQESNNLRSQNAQLMQENDRYRGLIETLLRHPSFTPFLQDISQDPSVLGAPQQPQQQRPSVTPAQQPSQPAQSQQQPQQPDAKPDYMNFDASQLQIPQQQPQAEQVGLAMIPEADFSKMNINGFTAMNFNNFNQRVNAFAVLDVPAPDPVDLLIESPVRLPTSCSASTASATGSSTCTSDMTLLLAKLDGAARSLNCTAVAT
jgi:bZIP-type transcription factor MBZ1